MAVARETFEELRTRLEVLSHDIKSNDDPRLKQFEKDFKTLIELLMFSLIRDKDNFFANILIQFNRKISYNLNAPAGVNFQNTYFNLYLNPFIMLKYNLNEMKAILIHECYHVLNQHIKRSDKLFGKYSNILINIACDVAINQFIHDLPQGTLDINFMNINFPEKAPFEINREMEYYFNKIKDNKNFEPIIIKVLLENSGGNNRSEIDESGDNGQSGNNSSEIDESGDNGQSGNNESGNLSNDNSDKIIVRKESLQNEHDIWKESDKENNYENMNDVVGNILNTAAQKCRGYIPGNIQEMIRKLNEKPILSWQDILKRYVGSIPVPYKKTITRKDRRQPDRLDLRGKLSDHYADIICAIDTSGSMKDIDIEYCMNEIFNIVKNVRNKITIIECDSRIQKVYEVKNPREVSTKVHGRGGTNFSPVFEYIKEHNLQRTILIYFTDGWGERELTIKPVNFRTLWVLTGNAINLSVKDVGEIRELKLDEKYKKMIKG